jgi:hypothetical protein
MMNPVSLQCTENYNIVEASKFDFRCRKSRSVQDGLEMMFSKMRGFYAVAKRGTVGDNYLKSKFKVASENTKKCKVGPPNQPTFPANPPTHT